MDDSLFRTAFPPPEEHVGHMSTQTHTHQTATWRPDARLRSRVDVCTSNVFAGRINGNYGMSPSASKVTFLAIAPTRRGAPPL